jgi:flagellar hook-basal body complex protein FliE
MTLPITPIQPTLAPVAPVKITPPASDAGAFRNLLEQSLSTVESQRVAAQASVDRFLSGEGEELHQVALATQKAELSFELFMQVRNKAVQAYQEIMRMQL